MNDELDEDDLYSDVPEDPDWGDWVDQLEALLQQEDHELIVLDFDRKTNVLLILGRQLDDYDWKRYDTIRAVLTGHDGKYTAKIGKREYARPLDLAEQWMAQLKILAD